MLMVETRSTAAVRFSTRKFEASHGRKPRGTGQWAFVMAGEVVFAPACQTLTEAKKWAKAEAQGRGVTVVEVAP